MTEGVFDFIFISLKNKINAATKIDWSCDESITNDNTSFYLVAMAFCKNESQRIWLANLETKLYSILLLLFFIINFINIADHVKRIFINSII